MIFLALRHLTSRKSQTLLIFLGIGLGTLMFTVISGMQLGMREFVVERLMNNTSHIKISAREQIIDKEDMTRRFYGGEALVHWLVPPAGIREEAHILYPQGWFDRLRDDPEVLGYSPGFSVNVIVSKGAIKLPATLAGVVPALHNKVMNLDRYITSGDLNALSAGGSKIIAGDGLLKKIGAREGDTLLVSSGQGSAKPFKLVGTLVFGVPMVDEILILGALKDVQQLNHSPGRINEIAVNLVNMDKSEELAQRWQLYSRDKVESWQQANANFLQIFVFQDIVRMAVTIAILTVAGFGIYNVLSIMVAQKRKEIAILRSMGYPPKMILELFLVQGVILGVAGALIGMGLGYAVNLYLATIELGGHMGMGNRLMISQSPSIYFTGFMLAFVSALAASLLPAWAASRLTPMEIIRSEV